jgi:hypothetical protein
VLQKLDSPPAKQGLYSNMENLVLRAGSETEGSAKQNPLWEYPKPGPSGLDFWHLRIFEVEGENRQHG